MLVRMSILRGATPIWKNNIRFLEVFLLYLVERCSKALQSCHHLCRVLPVRLHQKVYISRSSYLTMCGHRISAYQQVLNARF